MLVCRASDCLPLSKAVALVRKRLFFLLSADLHISVFFTNIAVGINKQELYP